MYTVKMEKECACFKKSEYSNNMTFETQKDAYNYAKIVAEFMNEEFCGQHIFSAHRGEGNYFLITVAVNTEVVTGTTAHITCDTGCGSTDNWSLEATSKTKSNVEEK
jgi:hypothetical protein